MLEKILKLRFVFLVAVVVTLINALFFLWLGVKHAIHGYHDVIWNNEGNPGLYFVESLDVFMISLVFMIFAVGIMRVFTHYKVPDADLPGWLRFNNFKELKILLWETILVTLFVISLSTVVKRIDNLGWDVLILPCFILISSLSLLLIKKAH